MEKSSDKPFSWLPRFRDQSYGWLHFAALGYAIVTNVFGLVGMYVFFTPQSLVYSAPSFIGLIFSIVIAAHGKIVGSYLVHEAAHGTIFEKSPTANEYFGILALMAAGCPYLNFRVRGCESLCLLIHHFTICLCSVAYPQDAYLPP